MCLYRCTRHLATDCQSSRSLCTVLYLCESAPVLFPQLTQSYASVLYCECPTHFAYRHLLIVAPFIRDLINNIIVQPFHVIWPLKPDLRCLLIFGWCRQQRLTWLLVSLEAGTAERLCIWSRCTIWSRWTRLIVIGDGISRNSVLCSARRGMSALLPYSGSLMIWWSLSSTSVRSQAICRSSPALAT